MCCNCLHLSFWTSRNHPASTPCSGMTEMASAAQTLYLIDGHAQLYRAYHAVQARMFAADRKTPTNAVFGFGNMMRNLRSRFKPDLLAAVFDPHGPVKREELYQAYAKK